MNDNISVQELRESIKGLQDEISNKLYALQLFCGVRFNGVDIYQGVGSGVWDKYYKFDVKIKVDL